MSPDQAIQVRRHIQASWPHNEIPGQTPATWDVDLQVADYECAIQAVDNLRRHGDGRPPNSAQLLAEWKHVHVGAHPQLPPAPAQVSPYGQQGWRLVSGASAFLLLTPAEHLDAEGKELKTRVLELAGRHVVALSTAKPGSDMLSEVIILGEAIERWGETHKQQIGLDRARIDRLSEHRREQRRRPEPAAAEATA